MCYTEEVAVDKDSPETKALIRHGAAPNNRRKTLLEFVRNNKEHLLEGHKNYLKLMLLKKISPELETMKRLKREEGDMKFKHLFQDLSHINIEDNLESLDNEHFSEYLKNDQGQNKLQRARSAHKSRNGLYEKKSKPFKFLILPPKRSLSRMRMEVRNTSTNKTNKVTRAKKDNGLTGQGKNICVDLFKVNDKLKTFTHMNFNDADGFDKVNHENETSLIIEENKVSLKEQLEHLISSNINELKYKINETLFKSEKPGIICYRDRLVKSTKHIEKYKCMSLKLYHSIPISMIDFGRYLINHIESEDKFKIEYLSSESSLLKNIEKKLVAISLHDHGMLKYLIDKWDSIDLSYERRLYVLKKLIYNPRDIYFYLEKETEALSDYVSKTEALFKDIQYRERLKYQISNKKKRGINVSKYMNELGTCSANLKNKLKRIKVKYDIDVIWRGIVYEWVF
jgi:hypothetical protein